MISRISVLLCVLLLAMPAHARKQSSVANIDFSRITCGEFVQEIVAADEDATGSVLLWIDGYLSGVSGDTLLDWSSLESYSTRLVEYCADHPKKNLLEAAKKVGIQ
jgi:acid stress chaperone HdeB